MWVVGVGGGDLLGHAVIERLNRETTRPPRATLDNRPGDEKDAGEQIERLRFDTMWCIRGGLARKGQMASGDDMVYGSWGVPGRHPPRLGPDEYLALRMIPVKGHLGVTGQIGRAHV